MGAAIKTLLADAFMDFAAVATAKHQVAMMEATLEETKTIAKETLAPEVEIDPQIESHGRSRATYGRGDSVIGSVLGQQKQRPSKFAPCDPCLKRSRRARIRRRPTRQFGGLRGAADGGRRSGS